MRIISNPYFMLGPGGSTINITFIGNVPTNTENDINNVEVLSSKFKSFLDDFYRTSVTTESATLYQGLGQFARKVYLKMLEGMPPTLNVIRTVEIEFEDSNVGVHIVIP